MPRRVLLTGTIILVLVIVFAFAFVPNVRNPAITLICDNRIGFCEDTTREDSVEKNAKGQIQKRTEIIKYQSGKTLWDWLSLFLVPVLLIILGYLFQSRDQRRAEQQANTEKNIANEYLRDEALQAYIDRMSELLLDRNLILSGYDHPVRDVARTRTLTILRRLSGDGERKARVLQFLYDAGLLDYKTINSAPLVNLPLVKLIEADFGEAKLGVAKLSGANLEGVNLSKAYLGGANLEGANLGRANLWVSYLLGANLQKANMEQAILVGANLEGAILVGAHLVGANMQQVNLVGAILVGANLGGAILVGANLEGAILVGANLEGAILVEAKNCPPDQIKTALNWEKATYSSDFRQKLGLP